MFRKRKDKLFEPSEQQQGNFTTFLSPPIGGSLSSQSQTHLWESSKQDKSQRTCKGAAATGVTSLGGDSQDRRAIRVSSMGSLEVK